jgi:glucose-1-phosphate cytidylyltransferase
MKALILAGGTGLRLREETHLRPKPMVEVGGKPILWHIMKIYSHYGVNDFVICLGYLGYIIKEFFFHYSLHLSDVTIDVKEGSLKVHTSNAEPWRITLVDTGQNTMTGGRIKRAKDYLDPTEPFFMTYGDGVADVDLNNLLELHKAKGRLATVTAVQQPARFGALAIEGDSVYGFVEKPIGETGWVNGGFFVLSPNVIEHIDGDDTVWERDPIESLSRDNQLAAYKHAGFWQPMDTLRDKLYLDDLWNSGAPPWKVWPD